ncbi:hypothetical protein [Croceitalea rosinachiae]|uniref:Uncharacterized protein n=1 Tax=Croceitalea rosinachiae TaxID=3075596 RepID=A0ABU3A7E7_9FLAO|nr:hypothetical protein [Croceitalea sp. F388]MDT0605823.1 hypothetical protein [Croceitalea sp. F388]
MKYLKSILSVAILFGLLGCSKESKRIIQEDKQLLDYYLAEEESDSRGYSYFVIKGDK